MRTSALFHAKNFFEIYGVSVRTREEVVEPMGRVSQFFAILCRRLCWMAPILLQNRSLRLIYFQIALSQVVTCYFLSAFKREASR